MDYRRTVALEALVAEVRSAAHELYAVYGDSAHARAWSSVSEALSDLRINDVTVPEVHIVRLTHLVGNVRERIRGGAAPFEFRAVLLAVADIPGDPTTIELPDEPEYHGGTPEGAT